MRKGKEEVKNMIHAKFSVKDGRVRMDLQGPAGSAPRGEDLVCSAATMLAYTAAQAAQFLLEQGKLKERPEVCLEAGAAAVSVMPPEEALAAALHPIWVVQCGIHVLAHNYPQNVKLECMKV